MLSTFSLRQKIGLFVGPALFLIVLFLPLPEDMSPGALKVAAVALLMASFWISEVMPIPVTAMLPIFMFPVLGVMPTSQVTASYGNQILFLFMGGFMIAVAMQKWNLHRRIALNIIYKVGSSPNRLILGFMIATASLSMWISNTATAMMMMPVALAVIEQTRRDAGIEDDGVTGSYKFGTALMLAIAYSASIGGVATLIGTPPNAIFIGIIDTLYGYQIGFWNWMMLGIPISLSMLTVCWFVLTRVAFKLEQGNIESERAHLHIQQELTLMGKITPEESRVAWVFFLVAISWVGRGLFEPEWLGMVSDPAIAMAGAFVLFGIPASKEHGGFILDWQTATTIPWGIIVLMGGGFALAGGFSETELTGWLANQLNILQGVHIFIIVLSVVLFITFLTEVTSNAATATMFIPVMGALAITMGLHPFALMVPAAVAASMAFMLPVATPPNAIVFASQQVTIAQMASTGIMLNIIGAVLVSTLSYLLLPVIM
jgi:solute carrier family 13 (sodium-dependent dicarboxylate transporter), member 2/3/5